MTDIEEIYKEYFKDVQLFLLALSKSPDLAEELTAQTFFRAMGGLEKFRGNCDIRTWLFSIAKNCYFTHLRKEKTVSLESVALANEGVPVEEMLWDKLQAMELHKLLHSLPEPYKEVFSLRVFGQLSFVSIAEIFGRTQNWACVTYHRARQKIIRKMEGSE